MRFSRFTLFVNYGLNADNDPCYMDCLNMLI